MTKLMMVLASGICITSSAAVNGDWPGTMVFHGTTATIMLSEPT